MSKLTQSKIDAEFHFIDRLDEGGAGAVVARFARDIVEGWQFADITETADACAAARLHVVPGQGTSASVFSRRVNYSDTPLTATMR